MVYAFCLTAVKGRPVRSAISLALPRGKSFLSNLTSSSDHATQLFFFISAFSIPWILWDFGQKGNARLGCGDGGEEIKVRVKLDGKKNGERSSKAARLIISGPLILLVNTLSV